MPDLAVHLTPLTLADADEHLRGEDAEMIRWLSLMESNRESVDAYIMRTIVSREIGDGIFAFGIRVGSIPTIAGSLEIQTQLPFLAESEANISYGVYPRWRHQGIATRAVLCAFEFLATLPGITQAVIRADPENEASIAVAKHAGFTFDRATNDSHGSFNWYVRPVPNP